MFASMCVLMVFNLVFVKLVLSALSTDPNGAAIIPWTMLVVGIVRMAKKMDGIILRIGMNPALTGDPLGTHFPGALTAMTLRSIASIVTHTAAKNTPSSGHSNTSGPPPQGDPILRGGMAGGAARPASGASGKTGSPQSMAGQKNTALSSAAVNGAGSGVRMAGTMAAFHSRYGADHAETMQQVRQAISIDADDWDDASYTGSSVVQSGTSQTVSGTGSRVMPPAPPMRPLPADFGRMSPPETADSKLSPVTPPRTADGQASHMVSPVSPQHIPRSPEQALQDFSGRNPAPEANGHAHGTTLADRARQSGKISPVMPRSPRQVQQNRMGVENHTSISNTEQPAAQPIARVTPSHPSIPAGGAQQVKDGTVAASGAAAVTAATAAAAAGSVMSSHAGQARISPAREVPPRATRPVSGSAASPARQQAASAGRQIQSPEPARVTPSAPHKPPEQTVAQVTAADRRPAVSPARRERKPERPDSASRLDVSPGVRTPDMVTPPPTGQPRTLRRSAQPLKNKAAPETQKRGGNQNRKRKRKK